MKEVTRVPKLRFGEFSNEWIFKRTKEIAPLQRGFDLPTSDVVDGEYPVVYSNGILRTHKEFKVNAPGVVTGRSGTIGKVSFVEDDFWPHNTTLWVTSFCNNYPKFIYYFYLNFKLERYNAGSTVPTLNRNDVHTIKKGIPSIPEQQKIASFLTSVDKKIDKLQHKKTLLEQYKKGLMQQIFSQELRFKDDNGDYYPEWKKRKLRDIGETLNGLTGKTKVDFGSGKPYIQYKQIFDSSKINIEDCGLVDIKDGENQTEVKYGDIFFTTSSETPNEIGTTSVLLDEVQEMYLNSFCFGLRVKKDVLNPSFAQFLFRSSDFRKKMIPLAQGSTRYNISKGSFLKLDILIPIIIEQTKIANFLSAIDEKIEFVNAQIETTQQFKKGLLQQMFV